MSKEDSNKMDDCFTLSNWMINHLDIIGERLDMDRNTLVKLAVKEFIENELKEEEQRRKIKI